MMTFIFSTRVRQPEEVAAAPDAPLCCVNPEYRKTHTLKWLAALLAAFFVFVMSTTTMAQTTAGRILGRVSDSSGATLPGVSVHLINEQTDATQVTTANNAGDYQFPQVPVGSYRLEFEQAGFKKSVQVGITLLVNQVLTVNMALQVGAVHEVVEVTSEVPLVDTTSTQLGTVVDDRSIVQLPLNARDMYQFIQLQPGVQTQARASAADPNGFLGGENAGAVSVNGGRGRANNFSVNGGDANDQFLNLPAVQPAPDSVQEFRVLTNTFDAEFGRNSGSVVNLVTKSGTNRFHGSAYEFVRNTILNTHNYFQQTNPPYHQNQFGSTFGGPIYKDHTFFFASYEGQRYRTPNALPLSPVPNAAQRVGNFSQNADGTTAAPFGGTLVSAFALNNRVGCPAAAGFPGGIPDGTAYSSLFPGNQIPLACADPVAVDLLQLVPNPNQANGFYSDTVFSAQRNDQVTLRLDHRISGTQSFTGYYYFQDNNDTNALASFSPASVPGFPVANKYRTQQVNLGHTWTISSSMVNEAHLVFMREAQLINDHPVHTTNVIDSCLPSLPGQPAVTTGSGGNCFSDPSNPKFGITPGLGPHEEGLPFIHIAGGLAFGNTTNDEPQVGNSFQVADNLTKIIGTHTLKFGGDFRRQQWQQTLYYAPSGNFGFSDSGPNAVGLTDGSGNSVAFPDYLLGFVNAYLESGGSPVRLRNTMIGIFAQDSWKIRPNLTLNYGLRWEYIPPLADSSERVSTFRPGVNQTKYPCQLSASEAASLGLSSTDCNLGSAGAAVFPTGIVYPGANGIPQGLTQTYYKSFAPRVGLAWSPSAREGAWRKIFGGPGASSIRAGYGIFYNPNEAYIFQQFSGATPFAGDTFITNTLLSTPFHDQFGNVFPNPYNGIFQPKAGQPQDFYSFEPILMYADYQPNMRTQYSEQYNLTVQRQLGTSMVFQLGYVGSQAHRLLATHEINPSNPQTCLDIIALLGANSCGQYNEDNAYNLTVPAGFNFHMPNGTVVTGAAGGTPLTLVGLRPYSSPNCNPLTGANCPAFPVLLNIFAQDTIANSNYNSLQAMLQKRFSKGLQIQASYTWSKSIDQASSFEDVLDPFNYRRTRAPSLFNAPHRFVINYTWELPVPKYSGLAGRVVDGWAVSGITTWQAGFPIRISSLADNELINSYDIETLGSPDQLKPFHAWNPKTHGGYWFDPSAFTDNASSSSAPSCAAGPSFGCYDPSLLGRFGNAPRSICCGPGIVNFDIALHKNIPINESRYFEFRAEFFNAFNHTNFLNPDGETQDGSAFGKIIAARDPRLIQLALKFFF
jgi:hypothetical protein